MATAAEARVCVDCGKAFRGKRQKCATCSATERACVECGKVFRDRYLRCSDCRKVTRTCECGQVYRSTKLKCDACIKLTERTCAECGQPCRGANLRCSRCRVPERECTKCGKTYRGTSRQCQPCRLPQASQRPCHQCGKGHRDASRKCSTCRRNNYPPEVRADRARARNNKRRARKRGAEVAGPVPASIYAAIRAEGICVYCGAPAESVDHIIPLARGGWEHPDNLVPACGPCNSSKGAKVLAEWDPERVAYAIEASEKVAQAWRARDAREADALGVEIGAPILAGAWLWHAASGVVEYGEVCSLADRVIRYEYEITDEPSSAP